MMPAKVAEYFCRTPFGAVFGANMLEDARQMAFYVFLIWRFRAGK